MTDHEAFEKHFPTAKAYRVGDRYAGDVWRIAFTAWQAALSQLAATQADVPEWIAVSERLPEPGAVVLACYQNRCGNRRRIRAQWIAAKSSEASVEYIECAEYDEETGTYYDPEGWYERIDNWGDYSAVAVCEGEVTHWMPLPAAPQPTQGEKG